MKLQNYVTMKKNQKKRKMKAKSILSSNKFDIKTLKESANKITIKKEQISLGITLKTNY